jgi:hypothetical protein
VGDADGIWTRLGKGDGQAKELEAGERERLERGEWSDDGVRKIKPR